MKKCIMCGKEKEESEFYKRKKYFKKIGETKIFTQAYCKECQREYLKKRERKIKNARL